MQSGNDLPNDRRAEYFGRCAVMMLNALRQESDADPFSEVTSVDLSAETEPGHEGIYDQALSNALAAIVAAEWPGKEANGEGRVHFARRLLNVIAEEIRPDPATGLCVIPDRDAGVRSRWEKENGAPEGFWDTRIDVALLTDALNVSGLARHGSGTGRLQHRHVHALLALDHHPALRTLLAAQSNRDEERAEGEDARSADQARSLLELIGDEEAKRRAKSAENPNAYDPRYNPDGHDFEECPVCGYETFCVQGLDMWGRVGFGQCVVCSYRRSPRVADQEGFGEHLTWLMGND
ncbi:hypothetical protein EASAB2608_01040 [Streptomyces sp. EAS-AB2608]|uniref:hypothetical protein n=1 Tax=Streptomyces sp. EAS-AB2608 TaxID=2779671 RepID=UPI001BEF29F0|nr:hypothetical protein [Streptomyces sp. EAS-AB2608]BCM65706.1 hypothetical protein EASAB2608_01040 [Streptomyces sp. EAS-AB2608]